MSVSLLHADLLYTLHVPSVPASITTTTLVSNNMTEIELTSLAEEYCQCDNEYHFHLFTSDGSLRIIHLTVRWTHINKVWNCSLVRTQLSKAAIACDKCLSHMPFTEMYMSTYRWRYNGADTENAKNS